MKKKTKTGSKISAEAVITTLIVGALLALATYIVIAFIWANAGNFNAAAQINVALVSGLVFGLAVGYRMRDLINP